VTMHMKSLAGSVMSMDKYQNGIFINIFLIKMEI